LQQATKRRSLSSPLTFFTKILPYLPTVNEKISDIFFTII